MFKYIEENKENGADLSAIVQSGVTKIVEHCRNLHTIQKDMEIFLESLVDYMKVNKKPYNRKNLENEMMEALNLALSYC